MKVYSRNVYHVIEKKKKKKILILYNISVNHYVGLTIYNKNNGNLTYINSINKYVDIEDLQEYNQQNIKELVYVKGNFLKITSQEFTNILKLLKTYLLKNLDAHINARDIESLNYLKWCYDKLALNQKNIPVPKLKQNSICWVDFGQNIGSEIRKLRPAILWRSTADKEMWTVIPLSTKCTEDNYYFHCDIIALPYGTAKVEAMTNVSYKRIREPFFYNKRTLFITDIDYENIWDAIQKYYLFGEAKKELTSKTK